MKKKNQFVFHLNLKIKIVFFLFLGTFLFSQTKISGSIIDEKTQKSLIGVEIFINNKEKSEIITQNSQFQIQSDSGISTATFIKKNFKTEILNLENGQFENLVVKMQPEKVEQIQEVVIAKVNKKKYKNKY